MALVQFNIASGTISFSEIDAFFGDGNPVELSEYYRGANSPDFCVPDITENAAVPASGTIDVTDLYSKYIDFSYRASPAMKAVTNAGTRGTSATQERALGFKLRATDVGDTVTSTAVTGSTITTGGYVDGTCPRNGWYMTGRSDYQAEFKVALGSPTGGLTAVVRSVNNGNSTTAWSTYSADNDLISVLAVSSTTGSTTSVLLPMTFYCRSTYDNSAEISVATTAFLNFIHVK